MEYLPSFRDSLTLSHEMTDEEFKAKKFGLPKLKKYPMPDAAHVRSAIKFFNYVTPSNEAELARAILARMEEYGISLDSMNIGDENRFKKYIENTELKHHGILGMKWGVRRYQNPDGSLTEAGKKRYAQSIDYIEANRKGLSDMRATANERYKMHTYNYRASKKTRDDLVKSDKDEAFLKKHYPNYDIGMNYDRKMAEYYKAQVKNYDYVDKKIKDIDVTKQSFKETKKMVEDIVANSTESFVSIQSKYGNSREVREYADRLQKTMEQTLKRRNEAMNNIPDL